MTTTARRDTLMLLAAPALICAMLTVALALMDANRAPWWAQATVGAAVLVSATVFGVQIERCMPRGETGGAREHQMDQWTAWGEPRRARRFPSVPDATPDERVFWQERSAPSGAGEQEEEEA